MNIRSANETDVAACVAMIEARREQLERYEPRFWKKNAQSAAISQAWFSHLFKDPEALSLVAEEPGATTGFLIARNFPPPPVYQLAGANALIDDFCVIAEDRWMDVGQALLDAAREALTARGYAQLVVIGTWCDVAKNAFLEQANLSLASTWWTAGL